MNYLYKWLFSILLFLCSGFLHAAQFDLDGAIEQGQQLNVRLKRYPQLLKSKASIAILDTLLSLKNVQRTKRNSRKPLEKAHRVFADLEQKLTIAKKQLIKTLIPQSKQLQTQVNEKIKELEGDPRFVEVIKKFKDYLRSVNVFLGLQTEQARLAISDDRYQEYIKRLKELEEYLLTYRVAPLTERGNRIMAALKKYPNQENRIQTIQERLIKITRNLNGYYKIADADKELYLDRTEELFDNLEQKVIPQIIRLQTKTYTKNESYKIYLRRQTRNMLSRGAAVVQTLQQIPEHTRDIPFIQRQLDRLQGFMDLNERWSDQEYQEYEGVLSRIDQLLKKFEQDKDLYPPKLKPVSRMKVYGEDNRSHAAIPSRMMTGFVSPQPTTAKTLLEDSQNKDQKTFLILKSEALVARGEKLLPVLDRLKFQAIEGVKSMLKYMNVFLTNSNRSEAWYKGYEQRLQQFDNYLSQIELAAESQMQQAKSKSFRNRASSVPLLRRSSVTRIGRP